MYPNERDDEPPKETPYDDTGDVPAGFVIIWDCGHACGELPGVYPDEESADAAGADWAREMIAIDDDPEAAEDICTWDVVEVTR